MNKNVAALLGIHYAKLTNLSAIMSRHVHQSMIANLPAHFGVTSGAIEHYIELALSAAKYDGFDDSFSFKKIVAEEFRWRNVQIFIDKSDRFLFLSGPSTSALFFHQLLKTGHINNESPFSRH